MRKTNTPHFIITAFIIFFNAIMIIFPKEIFIGAKNGLEIWFFTVIPSLLPFMITTNCLILLDFPKKFGQKAEPLTLRLFNLTGTQSFVLITGLTAGFPMGLKTLAQLYKAGDIEKREAHRLMLYCNNAGLLFMLGTVGAGFFGNARVGHFILLCSFLSVFCLAAVSGLVYPRQKSTKSPAFSRPPNGNIISKALESAAKPIFTIGGWIIVFSVLTEIFGVLHIYDGLAIMLANSGISKAMGKAAAIGIFEITNGCAVIPKTALKPAVTAACALCGWGGLSVHAQSLEFINDTDLSPLPYLAGKALNALLCAGWAAFLYRFFF